MCSQIVTTKTDTNMWLQSATTSPQKRRKDNLPIAFTEHGVTMLASLLNSEKAIKMNIAIVRAFIFLSTLAINNHEILNQLLKLRHKIGEHDTQLNQIYDTLENLLDKQTTIEKREQRQTVGFKEK